MLVTDIFNIYDSPTPLAVTDENNRLVGVVVRGSVIGAMTTNNKDRETNHSQENSTEEEVNEMFKQLPFSNWIDTIVNWLTEHLSGIFSFYKQLKML